MIPENEEEIQTAVEEKLSALEWWESANEDEVPKKSVLYNVEKGEAKGQKEYLFEYNGDVPSKHQIGLQFGHGKYLLFVTYKKDGESIVRSPRFKLSPRAYKRPEEIEAEVPVQESTQQSNQLGNIDIASEIAKGVSGAISGMVSSIAPFAPTIIEFLKPKQENPIKAITDSWEEANKHIALNHKQQAKQFNEFTKDFMNNINETVKLNFSPSEIENDEPESENIMLSLVQKLKTPLTVIVPKILKNSGLDISGYLNNPILKSLMNDFANNIEAQLEIQEWVTDTWGEEAWLKLVSLASENDLM